MAGRGMGGWLMEFVPQLFQISFIALIVNFMVVMIAVVVVQGPPPKWSVALLIPIACVWGACAALLIL